MPQSWEDPTPEDLAQKEKELQDEKERNALTPYGILADTARGVYETGKGLATDIGATAVGALQRFGEDYSPQGLARRAVQGVKDVAHWATSPIDLSASRGQREAADTASHALAAKAKADTKLTFDNRTGEEHSPPPVTPDEGPGLALAGELDADPAMVALREKARLGPQPGIRAFRTRDGKVTFTNLPGRYDAASEVPLRTGVLMQRGAMDQYQGAPPDPQNYAEAQDYALVQRAREASRAPLPEPGEPGLFSAMDLQPGTDRFGAPVATPGLIENKIAQLQDQTRLAAAGAQAVAGSMTPEDNARLAAYVKRAGNNALGLAQFTAAEIDRRTNDVSRARDALSTPGLPPDLKAKGLADLKKAEARLQGFFHWLTVTSRQPYFDASQPQGNNEVTPP